MKIKILSLLFVFTLFSCSSQNKNINRIDLNLLSKNKAEYFIILPSSSNTQKNVPFKYSLFIYNEFTRNISIPPIPFWKIKRPFYKTINSYLKENKINKENIIYLYPNILRLNNHYKLEIKLLNNQKEEIMFLIEKTKDTKNESLEKAVKKIIERMKRFIKNKNNTTPDLDNKEEIINLIKSKKLEDEDELIKLLYPQQTETNKNK